jgi:hypothetical protein
MFKKIWYYINLGFNHFCNFVYSLLGIYFACSFFWGGFNMDLTRVVVSLIMAVVSAIFSVMIDDDIKGIKKKYES